MDFSLLPDNVFLQIFRYLPFKDRVRSGEVNSSFRRISKISISETKVLFFRINKDDDRLTPAVLSALVELCSKNLEEVRFGRYHWEVDEEQLLEVFAQFHCPNLKTFQCSFADREVLNGVLVNNPNLKELIVKGCTEEDFPDITCEKLETLHCSCNDSALCSLTGRVPNLKVLFLHTWWNISPATMHAFLDTVPNLETLRIMVSTGPGLHFDREPANTFSFWRLERLITLEIVDCNGRSMIGDNSIMKVVKSFPRLRRLQLPALTMTNLGLAALSSLQYLQEVSLDYRCFCPAGRDKSAQCVALAVCGHLRTLRFIGDRISLPPSAVLTVLRSCRQLCEVHFWEFLSVYSPDEAEAVVRSLAGLGKREIRLTFYSDFDSRYIWRSTLVKAALKKLNDDEGLVVEFSWPNIPNDARVPVKDRVPAVEDHWDPSKDAREW